MFVKCYVTGSGFFFPLLFLWLHCYCITGNDCSVRCYRGKSKHFVLEYTSATEVIIHSSVWCVVSFPHYITAAVTWAVVRTKCLGTLCFQGQFCFPRYCVMSCIPAFRHVPHSWLISMECEVLWTCASLQPFPLLSRITHLLPLPPLPEPKHSWNRFHAYWRTNNKTKHK